MMHVGANVVVLMRVAAHTTMVNPRSWDVNNPTADALSLRPVLGSWEGKRSEVGQQAGLIKMRLGEQKVLWYSGRSHSFLRPCHSHVYTKPELLFHKSSNGPRKTIGCTSSDLQLVNCIVRNKKQANFHPVRPSP